MSIFVNKFILSVSLLCQLQTQVLYNQPTQINEGKYQIELKRGAIVFIDKKDGNLAIYDLYQSWPGEVYVTCDGKTVTMCPGMVLYVETTNKVVIPAKHSKPQKVLGNMYKAYFALDECLWHLLKLNSLDRKTLNKLLYAAVLQKEFCHTDQLTEHAILNSEYQC